MGDMTYEFERFSSREGFNRSLSHFKTVSSLLSDFERGANLADTLNDLLAEKAIEQNQIGAIVYALLADKYGYASRSYNLQESLTDFTFIAQETKKWNAVDLVVTYFHPELGLLVINPKNSRQWATVNTMRKNEVVTVFAGAFGKTLAQKNPQVFSLAIAKILEYLDGKRTPAPASLKSGGLAYREPKAKPEKRAAARSATAGRPPRARAGRPARRASAVQPTRGVTAAPSAVRAAPSAAPQAPAPVAAAAAPEDTGSKRMTPFYSVPVTNELFHNGNVEAWKKIIQSYQTKYPGCEVYVFYDGERIHDIHALFKWGKVKHGSTILFAVAGENIQDVAKLQRYLRQGASPRFEDFLRFPVNTVLKLF